MKEWVLGFSSLVCVSSLDENGILIWQWSSVEILSLCLLIAWKPKQMDPSALSNHPSLFCNQLGRLSRSINQEASWVALPQWERLIFFTSIIMTSRSHVLLCQLQCQGSWKESVSIQLISHSSPQRSVAPSLFGDLLNYSGSVSWKCNEVAVTWHTLSTGAPAGDPAWNATLPVGDSVFL